MSFALNPEKEGVALFTEQDNSFQVCNIPLFPSLRVASGDLSGRREGEALKEKAPQCSKDKLFLSHNKAEFHDHTDPFSKDVRKTSFSYFIIKPRSMITLTHSAQTWLQCTNTRVTGGHLRTRRIRQCLDAAEERATVHAD